MELKLEGMKESYADVIATVREHGDEYESRIGPMLELLNVQLILEHPERCLPRGTGRNLNTGIACVEALSLIAGEAYPQRLDEVSGGAFAQYRDGDVHHGSYGPRLRPQMETLLRRLQDDENSRQAVLTIWDPMYDQQDRRDLPCTVAMHFLLREDLLHMTTYMRSNDVFRGLPYDVFQFTQLQWTIANCLRVDAGTYRHVVGSLHLYDRDADRASRVGSAETEYEDEFYGLMPPHEYRNDGSVGHQSWHRYQAAARRIVEGSGPYQPSCNLVVTSNRFLKK